EPLLRAIHAVRPQHLRQTGIGRGEFDIGRFASEAQRLVDAAGIEIVGTAEIVLCASAANRRKLRVAINEEFYLALTPPPAIVHAPCHVGTDKVAAPPHAIENDIVFLVRKWIGAPKLSVKISTVFRHLRE